MNTESEKIFENIHQELIDGLKESNKYAQTKIYKLYYKAMYNTALRILNDRTEAEDVMQESFLKAFQRIDNYSGTGSFGSWLKRIVVNNSIDALCKSKFNLSLSEIGDVEFDDSNENYIEILNYKVDEIKKMIFNLSDNHRMILSLYLLEGYDHEEISQILDISYNTSRTRYSRARKKLLQLIENEKVNELIN
ncbi:MAG: RNA polymerase sigma factor [Bacteroidales bacterium]|nr:RNA polymerase sigma factor [Bacteroidales bacterium]